MLLLSSIHRASAALCGHLERAVLSRADLNWSDFVTLWCLWIFGDLEICVLAIETGIAKSTLSNILTRLEARNLVIRRARDGKRRLLIAGLTESGDELMSDLFPYFNAEETRAVESLSARQIQSATNVLRAVISAVAQIAPR